MINILKVTVILLDGDWFTYEQLFYFIVVEVDELLLFFYS